MKLTCISDLHGFVPELGKGDILIVAGDLTAKDEPQQHFAMWDWLANQNYKQIIIIAGNHDNFLQTEDGHKMISHWSAQIKYLCDSGTEFEGLKIWGSPWSKTFPGINPHCKAFTVDTEEGLDKKWWLIPLDTDILITHSPPFTIKDMTTDGHQVGSISLMAHHISRLRPKLWVFGHIHEDYGRAGPYHWNETNYVNGSHVNEHYKPVNKPINIIL